MLKFCLLGKCAQSFVYLADVAKILSTWQMCQKFSLLGKCAQCFVYLADVPSPSSRKIGGQPAFLTCATLHPLMLFWKLQER